LLIVVWLLAALYTSSLLHRGWVPHDEGTLAQSAERALAGELPHRDFDDPYTGELSELNALAFRVWGANLASPRIILFVFFLLWVPVVYSIALRFASALGAAAVTVLAVAWSVPNYTAAVPSWYNLFFATFGTAAALRFLETERRGWLFLCGMCGGISFLFKLPGLYFVAAVLLVLVLREAMLVRRDPEISRPSHAYRRFLRLGLGVFLVAVCAIVRWELSLITVVVFLLPIGAIAALCWREGLRFSPAASVERFASFFRMVIPFLLGVVLPVALFLVPYVHSGSVHNFLYGVFVLPGRRLELASRRPPGYGLNKLVATAALVYLLAVGTSARVRLARVGRVLVIALLATVLIASAYYPRVLQLASSPLLLLFPTTVLAGAYVLIRAEALGVLRRQQLMLLITVAALGSLIQVPFSASIYFCYAAPLLALALLAVLATRPRRSAFVLGTVAVFYTAFAVLRITPSFVYAMGNYYQPDRQTKRLNLGRAGGLRVDPQEAAVYERLIPLVEEHARGTGFTYCAPDCPEVYFLAGVRNPTRTIFDFFDEPVGRTERVLGGLGPHDVQVIVILTRPPFSPPMAADLRAALVDRYPESQQVGRFEVRWR